MKKKVALKYGNIMNAIYSNTKKGTKSHDFLELLN